MDWCMIRLPQGIHNPEYYCETCQRSSADLTQDLLKGS
jgi:hypothetical protein